jgi:hypothetical protein
VQDDSDFCALVHRLLKNELTPNVGEL